MSLEQQTNIASVQVFQASFANWYLFIQDRIFNELRSLTAMGGHHFILILACNGHLHYRLNFYLDKNFITA